MSDTLDLIDRSILSMLQDDARTPYVKIADQLGVSDATIHIRVRKLVNEGIIKQFTVLLDEEKVSSKYVKRLANWRTSMKSTKSMNGTTSW
jgi:Lrp/AsnC family transcriptional regulator for asnA, asnC and gidA